MSAMTPIKRKVVAQPGLHLLLLFILLFVLAWPSITSLLFFISDTGLRYLQIQELIEHGWHTFAIDYPGQSFDPELRHVPYYDVYYVIEEELYLSITPFFPLLASYLYAAIGKAGLVLLPVLGGVMTAAAGFYIARWGGLRHRLLFLWGVVFFTPVLFYSMELWDHTLASALSFWGVALVVYGIQQGTRWPLLLGGMLVSLAIGQRGEVIVFAPALALGLLVVTWPRWQPVLLYAAGGLIGIAPVALLNLRWVGHPLGLPLAPRLFRYGVPDYYPVRPTRLAIEGVKEWLMLRATHLGRFLFHIDPGDVLTATATMLVLFSILLLVFALRLRRYRNARIFGLGLALAVLAHGLWLVRGVETSLVGLITSFPLIAFSMAYVDASEEDTRPHQPYKLVLVSAWTFIFLSLLLTLIGYGSHGGAQWGARYLLPVYPMLLYMAFYTYEVWRERLQDSLRRVLALTFAGLLLLSLIFQFAGARLLIQGKQTHRQPLQDQLASLPNVILTNVVQIPSLSTAQEDKIFLWVNDEEEIRSLVPIMVEHNVERFALLADGETELEAPQRAGEFTIREVEPSVYKVERNVETESLNRR